MAMVRRRVDALTCVIALGSALLTAACGKSDSPGGSAAGAPGASGTGGSGAQAGADEAAAGDTSGSTSCPTDSFNISFKPMYSAYIPDSVHTFQIPAVAPGITAAIDWSASDPTLVDLAPDATTGGVMITTKGSGTVTIIAKAGNLCGSSLLTITEATDDDWTAGNARYNDGVIINRVPGMGMGMRPGAGGSGGSGGGGAAEAACTNCHGESATNLQYKTVSHTPEQTGGFSDTELAAIFQTGTFPVGTGTATAPQGFDLTVGVTYQQWQGFHKWDVGDNAQSVVVYLRSLTPEAQTGTTNFGGVFGMGGAGGGTGRGPRGNGGGSGFGNPGFGGTGAGGAGAGGTAAGGAGAGGAAAAGAPTAGAPAGGAVGDAGAGGV